MEGGGAGEEKRKTSFGFNLADEKIKLIDILSEDDDFLVASPFCDSLEDSDRHGGCRLSEFGNSQEAEKIQQKRLNLLPSDVVQPPRPSFLRRSLAWDSAFFNNAGVLDLDELSFINKGFRTTESHLLPGTPDVRNRRSESESTPLPNGDDFSLDWFEIEPSIYRPKSSKVLNVANRSPELGLRQQGLQNIQSLKKVDKSFRNKMKSNQTSTRKNTNTQSEGKMKKESTSTRRQGTKSSPKPPQALGRTMNILTGSNNRDLSGKSNARMENKSATTGSGQGLAMEKKSASHSSSGPNSGSRPSPISSCIGSPTTTSIGASSPQASNHSKRKTESRKNQLSASFSTSKIWRHPERSKVNGNLHLQSQLSPPKQYSSQVTAGTSSVAWLADKTSRPSGLRPPSTRITFFNENTPPRFHGVTRSTKMPQKVSSEGTPSGASAKFGSLNSELLPDSSINLHVSACKKLKSPCSEVANNVKRSKVDHNNTSLQKDEEMRLETARVGDHGKRPRDKHGLNSSLEEERRDVLKNKRCRESQGPKGDSTKIHIEVVNTIKKNSDEENGMKNLSCSEDQVGNLSRYFKAIDLNQDKMIEKNKQREWHSKCNKNNIENHNVPAYLLFKQENELLDAPMASSKPCKISPLKITAAAASILSTRTPLADKPSLYLQPK